MGQKGLIFPSGGGGLKVPQGSIISYSGSTTVTNKVISRDNSVLNRTEYPGLFNEIGLINALTASFSANAAPIITANNYTGTSNGITYTITKSNDGESAAWKLFDANAATYWLTNAGVEKGQWVLLELGTAVMPFLIELATNGSLGTNNPAASGNVKGYDGSAWSTLAELDKVTWSASETKSFPQAVFKTYTKFIFNSYYPVSSSYNGLAAGNIKSADLSKLKIPNHPFNTGDAVTVWEENDVLPNGYVKTTTYYTRDLDTDHVSLHDTAQHASDNTNVVPISDAGAGTFKIWHADTFPVGNVIDSYYAL
jgi:hypothetical protein